MATRHQKQLDALAEKDPEFFEFLQKNSKELLDFQPSGSEGEDSESEDSQSDDEQAPHAGSGGDDSDGSHNEEAGAVSRDGKERDVDDQEGGDAEVEVAAQPRDEVSTRMATAEAPELTLAELKRVARHALEKRDKKSIRRLVHALRAAAFSSDDADGQAEAGRLRYTILSPTVYRHVLLLVLRRLPALLWHAIGPIPSSAQPGGGSKKKRQKGSRKRSRADAESEAENAPSASQLQDAGASLRVNITQGKDYHSVKPMIRATINAILHLLPTIQDRALLVYALRCLRGFLPFFRPFPKFCRKVIKALLTIWGNTEDPGVRLTAFLRLRQCLLDLAAPHQDAVLKGLYLTYLRNAKFMSDAALPKLTLMAHCIVEAYGIYPAAAYRHVFIYLRQLALHLRSALVTKTKDAMQNVLCWQFVNALRVWTAVLRTHAVESEAALNPLVHPLVQLLLGTARLRPGPAYIPLQLHMAELCLELGWATGVYIPVAPLLLEVLHLPLWQKPPKTTGKDKPPSLRLTLRVQASTMHSKTMQEVLMNRTLDLLLDSMRQHFYSVALPEFAAPVLLQLRAFAKRVPVPAWKQRVRAIVSAVEDQCGVVLERRSQLDAAPSDTSRVAGFMAEEAKAARAARLAQSRQDVVATEREAQRSARSTAAGMGSAQGPSEEEQRRPAEEEGDMSDGDHSRLGEDSGDDDSEDDTRERKRRRIAKDPLPALDDDDEDDEEDEVEDLVLSDVGE